MRCTLFVFSLLAACAPQPTPGSASDPSSSESDTEEDADETSEIDEEVSDTDGDVVVGAACDAYMDCLAETDVDEFAEVLDQLGAGGSCWEGGDAERCEVACENGLEDVRDGYGALVPACVYGASDEEILELSRRLCAQVPSEIDEEDVECVVDAVLECPDDASDVIWDCVYEAPNTAFESGIWELSYIPDPYVDDDGMSGCGLPDTFEVRIEGNGDQVTTFDILDSQGNVELVGDCSGTTGVSCFLNTEDGFDDAFQIQGTFDDPTTFDGWVWSKCGLWGDIEGTWVP